MTTEQIKKKLAELSQMREQILANANMELGKVEGMRLVWEELLKEADAPIKTPQTEAG